MNEPVGVLGRLSYSDINKNGLVESNEILSEADYYPFGLQHTENSIATTANKAAEKYQYNAKEFQDELNLNVFDYGARNYDAAIGRWFNHDPLSEMAYDLTPYRYGFNNPISFVDPNGMFESKKDAKDWARENGIRTGWFSGNSVTKNDDGAWYVDHKNEGMTYSRDAALADSSLAGADGVMGSAYVDMKESKDLSGNLGGYVFIGVGSENMKGRNDIEGKTKIIKATDMSGVGGGGASVSSKIVNLFSDLFTTASATNSIIEDVDGQIKRADPDKFVKYNYKKYSLYPKYIYSNEAEIRGVSADTILRRSQINAFKKDKQFDSINLIPKRDEYNSKIK